MSGVALSMAERRLERLMHLGCSRLWVAEMRIRLRAQEPELNGERGFERTDLAIFLALGFEVKAELFPATRQVELHW